MSKDHVVDIQIFNKSFLEKTLKDRMIVCELLTIEEYLNYLDRSPEEFKKLRCQLSNSYSEFFRNPLTFSLLEQSVFPKIINEITKNQNNRIRIWSAGCASGQEPYSLAMLLDNFKNSHKLDFEYCIFATDTVEEELESARRGVFDFKDIKNTRIEFAERYFTRTDGTFKLDARIIQQVNFSHYDLLDKDSSAPPASIYGDFDLIVCSNVFFYYCAEYQNIILNKIYKSLKPDGFFITGEAETGMVDSFGGFRKILSPAPIYVKNNNY